MTKIRQPKCLEYVASGCNFTRITNDGAWQDPANLDAINGMFLALQKPKHKFSIMYNAFQEERFGPLFQNYKDSVYQIHADSGGLQMVTQGKTPTPKLRTDVYHNQRFCDVAMSFDEIPVFIAGERSTRLDMSNRFFDPEIFEGAAKQTGQNLAEQLIYFDKNNIQSKPLLIAQGNSLDTYFRWVKIAITEVPETLRPSIGGLAMGYAALGNGMLEDIKRAYYFSQFKNLEIGSHLHLLGVGSLSRILPHIVFVHNGVYPDIHISYDSSTHTSGPEQGRHYIDKETIAFGKVKNETYSRIYDDILRIFGRSFDLDLGSLHGALTCGGYVNAQRIFGSTKEAIQAFVIMFAASVANFQEHTDDVIASKEALLNEYSGIKRAAIKSLYEVKTVEDFQHWEKHVGQSLPSNSVKLKPVSLQSLFE